MRDPLTAAERKKFESQVVEKWRWEYDRALASHAFDEGLFGTPGDCTVAKAALQHVFREVLLIQAVLDAARSYR